MLTIERHEVKCLHCNGKYFKYDGQDTCPHCGMRQPDLESLGKVEIEINLNQLTGEVTVY